MDTICRTFQGFKVTDTNTSVVVYVRNAENALTYAMKPGYTVKLVKFKVSMPINDFINLGYVEELNHNKEE